MMSLICYLIVEALGKINRFDLIEKLNMNLAVFIVENGVISYETVKIASVDLLQDLLVHDGTKSLKLAIEHREQRLHMGLHVV